MDNLPTLKPLKPEFKIDETTDFVKVSVTLKPRDKKRREATNVTEGDIRLYLDAAGVSAGKSVETPAESVSNSNIDSDWTTEWTFKKRDLRVKSEPPKAPESKKTTAKSKTSAKGK